MNGYYAATGMLIFVLISFRFARTANEKVISMMAVGLLLVTFGMLLYKQFG